MMHNIKLILEYDGTNYHGWQRQTTHPTIQETLETVLARIIKEPARVTGAGRTDAGVHAFGQVANFKSALKLRESSWVKAINSLLPPDVIVRKAEYVLLEFHARYSAKAKVYRYVILNSGQPSSFLRNFVWHVRHPLNVSLIKDASSYLIGTHDFSSFRASECSARSPVRTLDRLEIISYENPHFSPSPSPPPIKGGGICGRGLREWEICFPSPCGRGLRGGGLFSFDGDLILFTFEARSYLQHMVRNIVGTLIDVGRGKLKPSDVKDIIEKRDRRYAGPIAPPQGLFLTEIKYDESS